MRGSLLAKIVNQNTWNTASNYFFRLRNIS